MFESKEKNNLVIHQKGILDEIMQQPEQTFLYSHQVGKKWSRNMVCVLRWF